MHAIFVVVSPTTKCHRGLRYLFTHATFVVRSKIVCQRLFAGRMVPWMIYFAYRLTVVKGRKRWAIHSIKLVHGPFRNLYEQLRDDKNKSFFFFLNANTNSIFWWADGEIQRTIQSRQELLHGFLFSKQEMLTNFVKKYYSRRGRSWPINTFLARSEVMRCGRRREFASVSFQKVKLKWLLLN